MSGSSGRTAKVSAMPSPKMRPPLTPKKGKVPVLLSSLPNKSALVTDSEDDSDDNETFHDTETIPDEAHAPMPPSPLSPRWTCASGPVYVDEVSLAGKRGLFSPSQRDHRKSIF